MPSGDRLGKRPDGSGAGFWNFRYDTLGNRIGRALSGSRLYCPEPRRIRLSRPFLKENSQDDRVPSAAAASPSPWASILLSAIIGFALWHVLISALAPATLWDALAYHLALPKLYLRAGRIESIPWMIHAHWPHLLEVVYGVPLAAGIPNLPALLHAGTALLILVWLGTVGRRLTDCSTSVLAVALMASQTVFLDYAGTPHCDAALALYYLLSVTALEKAIQQKSRPLWVVAGLLGGLAAATKLPGLLLVFLLSFGLLFDPETPRPRWRWAAGYGLCGLFVVLPWLLMTWRSSGDPVWPFLSGLLTDRQRGNAIRAAYIYNCHWHGPALRAALSNYGAPFLLIPLALGVSVLIHQKKHLPPYCAGCCFRCPSMQRP